MPTRKLLVASLAAVTLLAAGTLFAAMAQDRTVKIRIQSVIPTTADEVTMLNDFAADVAGLKIGRAHV